MLGQVSGLIRKSSINSVTVPAASGVTAWVSRVGWDPKLAKFEVVWLLTDFSRGITLNLKGSPALGHLAPYHGYVCVWKL